MLTNLGLKLDDIHAQYRHVRCEHGRLKKVGVAVSQIVADFRFESKQENGEQVYVDPNRRLRSAAV